MSIFFFSQQWLNGIASKGDKNNWIVPAFLWPSSLPKKFFYRITNSPRTRLAACDMDRSLLCPPANHSGKYMCSDIFIASKKAPAERTRPILFTLPPLDCWAKSEELLDNINSFLSQCYQYHKNIYYDWHALIVFFRFTLRNISLVQKAFNYQWNENVISA